jgi:hypothetical protein
MPFSTRDPPGCRGASLRGLGQRSTVYARRGRAACSEAIPVGVHARGPVNDAHSAPSSARRCSWPGTARRTVTSHQPPSTRSFWSRAGICARSAPCTACSAQAPSARPPTMPCVGSRLQRQPRQRGAGQGPEPAAGLPPALQGFRACAALVGRVLPLVQHRAPSQRPHRVYARASFHRRLPHGGGHQAGGTRRPVRPASGELRPRPSGGRPARGDQHQPHRRREARRGTDGRDQLLDPAGSRRDTFQTNFQVIPNEGDTFRRLLGHTHRLRPQD